MKLHEASFWWIIAKTFLWASVAFGGYTGAEITVGSNIDLLSCLVIFAVSIGFSYFGLIMAISQDVDRSALGKIKTWKKPHLIHSPLTKGFINPARIAYGLSYFFLANGVGLMIGTLSLNSLGNIYGGLAECSIGLAALIAVRISYRSRSWKY